MKKSVLVILLFLTPFLTGCFGVNGYFKSVRNDIIEHLDVNFAEDTEFALGSVTLGIAGWFVPEDEEASQFLDDIKAVQVGVYKKDISENTRSHYTILEKIDRRMKRHGWHYIVKSCSKDEVSAIYVNKDLERGVKRMFIVSLNNEELVILQIDGNLSRIIETAVHDRGLDLNY